MVTKDKKEELVQLLQVVEGISYLDFSDSSLINDLNVQGGTLLVPSYVQGILIYPGDKGTEHPRITSLRKLEKVTAPYNRAKLELITAQPIKEELQKTLIRFAEQNCSSTLTLEEKIQIFDNVSKHWPDSPECAWCMELVPRISARNPISVQEELYLLGALISAESLNYLLDIKIGYHSIASLLDGWQPDTQRSFRLVPHGIIFENLAGDSALMAYMMVEDLLFGNSSIVKTGDEYISHLAFAHLINRISPELGKKIAIYPFPSSLELDTEKAPILNPLYKVIFPKNGKLFIDGVGSSGGPAAIESIRSMAPAGIPIFENHPKYSAGLIIYPSVPGIIEDSIIEDTVQKMIDDGVLLHEQEACNNIRMIAISGHESYFDKTVEYIQTSLEELSSERKKIYQTGEAIIFGRVANNYLVKNDMKFKRSRRTPDWGMIIYNNGSHPTNMDIDNCMRRVLTVVPMTAQEFIDFWSQPELRRFTQTVQYAVYNPIINEKQLITSLAYVGFDDIYNQHTPQYVVKSHDGELAIRKAKLVNGPLVEIEDWQKTAEYINKSIEYNK